MNFKTAVILHRKLYKILKKFDLEDLLSVDNLIDNNFPQIMARLQTFAKTGKIAISATNGKKTTTDLVNHILSTAEKSYVTNVLNDSKRIPVFTSIVLDLARFYDAFNGAFEKDYYVMALDEFELAYYFNSMKFDYLLLSNIFYDQKDLVDINEKRKRIQEALVLNSKTNLIINADEPMFYDIDENKIDSITNKKRNKFYYGFEKIEFGEDSKKYSHKNDLLRCPICGCKLDYEKRFYSHLGDYNCACGFKRPKLDIVANAKIFSDYTFLDVFYNDNKYVFRLPFGGTYNAYNALGAISLALNLGIDRKTITTSFESYEPIIGRDEIVNYKNKNVKIKVIKNPVSLSETALEIKENKNIKVVFCLNDKREDGLDTSWIWNSNLESVRNFENKIYVCGTRYDDMALRLKYAGLNPCLIVMDDSVKNAIKCCYWDLEENEEMLILTVPSLLQEVHKILDK